MSGEEQLVQWLASRQRERDPNLLIGLGDDMAQVRCSPDGLLITADMLMDGVDFDTTVHSPEQIGRKALAASLSDCAAMAVRPRWAVVSLALPRSWSVEQAKGLFLGMEPLVEKYECRLVGGDTNSWDHPLVIDVTVMAEPWPGLKPVRRDRAKPGDVIIVTGELGGSRAEHHLTFEPRIHEAKWLAEQLGDGLHAMMDLSDGLSTDGRRLAEASGIGIQLDSSLLESQASRAALSAARQDGRSVLDHVLNDGEDFELLFAADIEAWDRLKEPPRMRKIGTAIREDGVWLAKNDGAREAIPSGGWRHQLRT